MLAAAIAFCFICTITVEFNGRVPLTLVLFGAIVVVGAAAINGSSEIARKARNLMDGIMTGRDWDDCVVNLADLRL